MALRVRREWRNRDLRLLRFRSSQPENRSVALAPTLIGPCQKRPIHTVWAFKADPTTRVFRGPGRALPRKRANYGVHRGRHSGFARDARRCVLRAPSPSMAAILVDPSKTRDSVLEAHSSGSHLGLRECG